MFLDLLGLRSSHVQVPSERQAKYWTQEAGGNLELQKRCQIRRRLVLVLRAAHRGHTGSAILLHRRRDDMVFVKIITGTPDLGRSSEAGQEPQKVNNEDASLTCGNHPCVRILHTNVSMVIMLEHQFSDTVVKVLVLHMQRKSRASWNAKASSLSHSLIRSLN